MATHDQDAYPMTAAVRFTDPTALTEHWAKYGPELHKMLWVLVADLTAGDRPTDATIERAAFLLARSNHLKGT